MSRPPGATVGGQAVLEGVMMRAPSAWAVAVRRPDGVIEAQRNELPRLSERSPLARFPFIRGILVLIESLTLGFRALSWSAQKAGEEEEEITRGQAAFTMVLAVLLAVAVFVVVPVLAAHWLRGLLGDSSLAFVLLDGVIRMALIVLYIWAISQAKDIQRVFQYHGAEHMTIHAYEAGDPLTVSHVVRYSPRHPRCGTSFILIVGMVAFVVFLALAPLPFLWQVISRLLLLPVIAGLSYEVLRLGSKQAWMAWANRPGIWLQAITTSQPEEPMIEVAIASLLAALDEDELAGVRGRGPVEGAALLAEYDPPLPASSAEPPVGVEGAPGDG